MIHFKITDFSPEVQARIKKGDLLNGKKYSEKVEKISRMNKTETRHAEYLQMERNCGKIKGWWFEPFNLRLAAHTYYRPDFMVVLPDYRVEIHETKGGFIREDSWIKLKIAAEMFPMWQFKMFQYVKGEIKEKKINE